MASEIFDVFPTPVMRVRQLLSEDRIQRLAQLFEARAMRGNTLSPQLAHTEMLALGDSPLLAQLGEQVTPHLVEFGRLRFGEALKWSIKELWVNVLDPGGRQAVHNHANSFISGVVYLTASDPASNTTFVKAPGGHDFVFDNTNKRSKLGPYSAGKWMSPDALPGDLLLFPSYLLHEVPVNRGGRRITLAFNAIPDRLEAWGYSIRFS